MIPFLSTNSSVLSINRLFGELVSKEFHILIKGDHLKILKVPSIWLGLFEKIELDEESLLKLILTSISSSSSFLIVEQFSLVDFSSLSSSSKLTFSPFSFFS